MKKWKLALYIALVLWIGTLSQLLVNRIFLKENYIIEALADIETEKLTDKISLTSKLTITVDYGTPFLTEYDKEELIEYLAGSIGLQNYEKRFHKGEKGDTISGIKNGTYADTQIQIIGTKENKEQEKHYYIKIALQLYRSPEQIFEYKQHIESAIKKLSVKEQQSLITFTGNYKGKLKLEDKNIIANQMLQKINASIVEENRTEELYTIYAYTGLISDYIKTNNKKVNVNICMTYEEEQNITTIYLATPILNEEW